MRKDKWMIPIWTKEHPFLTAILVIVIAFSLLSTPVMTELIAILFAVGASLVAVAFGIVFVLNLFFPKVTKGAAKGISHYIQYFSIEAYFHRLSEKKANKKSS